MAFSSSFVSLQVGSFWLLKLKPGEALPGYPNFHLPPTEAVHPAPVLILPSPLTNIMAEESANSDSVEGCPS